MISIIIPVYNQAEKLAKCLASINAQTYWNYEVIVVNDGSTDDVESAVMNAVKIINQDNRGANSARNRGAREAHQGEYLLFCDADIVLEPTMLEKMLAALEKNPAASFAYSSFKFGWKTFRLFPFAADKLKQMPYIHTTSLMRREHFPGFDEAIKRLQDWDLWLTMLEQSHTGTWINETLFCVAGGGTMSTWLPSFAYKLLPWLPSVKKYNEAMAVIKKKHHL